VKQDEIPWRRQIKQSDGVVELLETHRGVLILDPGRRRVDQRVTFFEQPGDPVLESGPGELGVDARGEPRLCVREEFLDPVRERVVIVLPDTRDMQQRVHNGQFTAPRGRRAFRMAGHRRESQVGKPFHGHPRAVRVQRPAQVDGGVGERTDPAGQQHRQIPLQEPVETEFAQPLVEECAVGGETGPLPQEVQPVGLGDLVLRRPRRLQAVAIGGHLRVAVVIRLDLLRLHAQPGQRHHGVFGVVGEMSVELDVVGLVAQQLMDDGRFGHRAISLS